MKRPAIIFLFSYSIAIFAVVGAQDESQVVRLASGLDDIVPVGAKVEKLAGNYRALEGPVWVRKGGYLLFSDLLDNVIYRWNPGDGKVSTFLEHSGFTGTDPTAVLDGAGRVGSNGTTLDPQGRVVFCARGDRQVVRLETNGRRTVLASHYEGKRLNGPNDIVAKSDGAIYFTDPFRDYPTKELAFNGVYLLKGGQLRLLIKDQQYPNGLALSHDERALYVVDSTKDIILKYDVLPDDTIANGRILIHMISENATGHPDGMKVDRKGNIYTPGPGGIWFISAEGKHLGTVLMPGETVRNLAFGEDDGKTLFVTGLSSLYRIRLKIPGVRP